jgi:hypothetical protein
MGLGLCRLIELPRAADDRGSLTFIEGGKHIPFDVKRVFYLHDVPPSGGRGAHAHRSLEQFLVCLVGGCDVALDDGLAKRSVRLDVPWTGLYIPSMIWASERSFAPGTVCLVLASAPYDENDYIRDYADFVRAVRSAG